MSSKNRSKICKVFPFFGVIIVSFVVAALLSSTALADDAQPGSSDDSIANVQKFPPEIETLFPKDRRFNHEAYLKLTTSREKTNPSLWNKRVRRDFSMGTYEGVCLDFHINLELYGGEFFHGSLLPPPHPKHPRKSKFRYVEWKELVVKDNVSIIRSYYAWQARIDKLKNQFQLWNAVSPIIRKLIIEDKIKVQTARVDVNNDGNFENVFRVIFGDRDVLHSPDGGYGYRSSLFIDEESDLAGLFNKKMRYQLEPFYYDDTLYFAFSGGVLQGIVYVRGGEVISPLRFRSICSLGKTKK